MKSNARRPFVETLWNHYRWVDVGQPYLVPAYERILGYGYSPAGVREEQDARKEEHWGRKETCRRCQRTREMGEFTNFPTLRGVALFLLVAVGTLATLATFAF